MGTPVGSTGAGTVEGAVSQNVRTKRKNVRTVERRGAKRRRRGEAALSKEECGGRAGPAHPEEAYMCTSCGVRLLQSEAAETASEEGRGCVYVRVVCVGCLHVYVCIYVCMCNTCTVIFWFCAHS